MTCWSICIECNKSSLWICSELEFSLNVYREYEDIYAINALWIWDYQCNFAFSMCMPCRQHGLNEVPRQETLSKHWINLSCYWVLCIMRINAESEYVKLKVSWITQMWTKMAVSECFKLWSPFANSCGSYTDCLSLNQFKLV